MIALPCPRCFELARALDEARRERDETRAAIAEYFAASEAWSVTHRAALWDGSKQLAHTESVKRLHRSLAALRALAKGAA
jgi:predicted DsbA family dithiol-disulfide isomerase